MCFHLLKVRTSFSGMVQMKTKPTIWCDNINFIMPAGYLKHKWHWCLKQMLKHQMSQRHIYFKLIIKVVFDLSCHTNRIIKKIKNKRKLRIRTVAHTIEAERWTEAASI